MTNEERAELVSMAACVLLGMVVRRSASSARVQVRYGLRKLPEVRKAVLEWMGEEAGKAPLKTHQTSRNVERGASLVEGARAVQAGYGDRAQMARTALGGGAKRQNTLEAELGFEPGYLDGVLTEENGFTVNAQGWVRVAEPVTV